MVYREDEQFKLMPLKATYKQHGKEHISYVAERKEMEAYEEMGHISNLSFEEAIYTSDQLERLEEAKGMPESDYQAVSEYVLQGTLQEGSALANKKQTQELKATLDMLVLDSLGGF